MRKRMAANSATETRETGANNPPVKPPRPRVTLKHWLARLGLGLLFVLLALWGAILSVCTLGRTAYRWHGFQVELRLLPAQRGLTTLALRPLGEVQAHTHDAPVALVATLEEIQADEIKKLVASNPKRDDLAHDFEQTARADLQNFVLRQFAAGALGGLLAPLLFHAKRARWYIVGSLLGAVGLAVALGNVYATFNNRAFRAPQYTGTLKQAPFIIQFGKDAFTKIEALSQKLQNVAKNLDVLYGRINTPLGDVGLESDANTFRILHISDIHNNPAALGFVRQVADQFKIRFIVDTGDLTDFGSPAETAGVANIGKLPYSYVSVLGNHDSQTIGSALASQINVSVLNGEPITIDGMTLLGLPNPASARDGVGSVDTTPEQIKAQSEKLLQIVVGMSSPPDIVAVHDPEEARLLWGRVPLILCGHEHRYYLETHDAGEISSAVSNASSASSTFKTVVCNAGTTGAAGGRYLDKDKGVPFSCAVLTFRRTTVQATSPLREGLNHGGHGEEADREKGRQGETEKTADSGQKAEDLTLNPLPSTLNTRPQLRGIDMIVLNGELNQYSITHYTFNVDAAAMPKP